MLKIAGWDKRTSTVHIAAASPAGDKRRNTGRKPFIAATCKPFKEAKNNELLASPVLPSRTQQETRCPLPPVFLRPAPGRASIQSRPLSQAHPAMVAPRPSLHVRVTSPLYTMVELRVHGSPSVDTARASIWGNRPDHPQPLP